MSLSPGRKLGPYEITAPLGAGGMGEVYRARDTRLARDVAVKILPAEVAGDASRQQRFKTEARAVAALSHPNIVAVFDVGTEDGVSYIVGELVDGRPLRDAKFDLRKTLEIAIQIASGLAAAHDAGIVHRDLKPDNILLTRDGRVKILDFGLAKVRTEQAGTPSVAETLSMQTAPGAVMGTVGYMSPEQVRGLPVNHQTDLFSFGVVLYEMVTGKRPFTGNSAMAICDAILHAQPRDFDDIAVPGKLKTIIWKLLEKDPLSRYGSADEVQQELKALEFSLAPLRPERLSRNAWIAVGTSVVLICVLAGWLWRGSRQRWALQTAAPEIALLVDAGEYVKAAALAREARSVLPNDPTLQKLWLSATEEVAVTTAPAEADVSIRPYRADPNDWQTLGKTPLQQHRVPRNTHVLRVAKPGFAPIFFMLNRSINMSVNLWPDNTVPMGMVVVKGVQTILGWPFSLASRFRPDDYLIGQHEVTNEEYKNFVDSGGYLKREFWTEPFVKDGRTIPWQEALALFRDTTGRPGPATWEVGSFPKGAEKHPVAGVSWYEAAAYARFAGTSLPTVYHWRCAAQPDFAALIVQGSNFSGKGTVPVGSASALSGSGTVDMAGNVKEWCLNESSGEKRFILGGGFGEQGYMFTYMDARSPWDRHTNFGFRCVKLGSPPAPAATAGLASDVRDVWKDEIVSDQVFKAFRGLYTYDRSDLHARVEDKQAQEGWSSERVSFDAAYGNERVIAHLFLPKNTTPPFQVVVYFPGAIALLTDRFDASLSTWRDTNFDFFLKSGRAVMLPIYKGTYDRRDGLVPGGSDDNPPAFLRDHFVMWFKDMGRSLDYLEERNDIDKTKIAYFGYSLGGAVAPVLLALEGRFKAAILSSGGTWFKRGLPEADPINFVTRVKLPVLMLNGRYDSRFPVESAQLPVFRRLGTPDKNKRHVLYDAGHAGLPYGEEVRQSLDWLDKYLGSVRH